MSLFTESRTTFFRLTENKVNLAQFPLNKLIEGAPPDKLFVDSGGFEDRKDVGCSRQDVDVSALKATHEEADTRIILHAINADVDTLTVSVRNTDVLLLLLSLDDGKYSKETKYIPIRTFAGQMFSRSLPSLLPFHAITIVTLPLSSVVTPASLHGQHLKFTTSCYLVLEKDNLLIKRDKMLRSLYAGCTT